MNILQIFTTGGRFCHHINILVGSLGATVRVVADTATEAAQIARQHGYCVVD